MHVRVRVSLIRASVRLGLWLGLGNGYDKHYLRNPNH